MSDLLDIFQKRHQEKLEQLKHGPVDEAFLDGVTLLLGDLRQAGAVVADPAKRGQLRALARFWGNVLYDHTGTYPDTTLQPPEPDRVHAAAAPSHRPLPPLNWILVGGAATLVIAAGLAAVGWFARSGHAARPVATPAPIVSQVTVGTLATNGTLIPADVFCAGTPQIAARFALDKIEPGTLWRWEVQRDSTTVISQTAVPWAQEDARRVAPILTGGVAGVEAGRYNLLVYVGEQMAAAHPFHVLATPPRIAHLRVSDVPEPTGDSEFAAGVRVLYLTYDYDGMCAGLRVAHMLYRDDEPLQESVEIWRGPPSGSAQVSFQAAEGAPFPTGKYEATVMVASAEAARVRFTIEEAQTPIPTPPPSPAFGTILIALGVQPDGSPILTAPNNIFDWNTKVVYAIFDYSGMSDGTSWAVVWRRAGREVARQEGFWDVESAGMQGRRWVAYYDPRGAVLPGGTYSVTLAIGNVVQRTANFQILFYVPPPTPTPPP